MGLGLEKEPGILGLAPQSCPSPGEVGIGQRPKVPAAALGSWQASGDVCQGNQVVAHRGLCPVWSEVK